MAFFKAQDLRNRGERIIRSSRRTRIGSFSRAVENFSTILNESKEPNPFEEFDIFLSHSYNDKALVVGLRAEIINAGFSVYVDWIDDPQLDRANVSRDSVKLVRTRMMYCKSMIYAFSDNAASSIWMPWELGFMDGVKEKVTILQINEISENNKINYEGREYLKLYKILDLSNGNLLVKSNNSNNITAYREWLGGMDPGTVF